MATHKKRRVNEEMETLESDSNGEEMGDHNKVNEDEDALNEQVDVDFEARTAEESDFHGIKKLLQQLFLKAHVNTGELADTIISQNYVGSVLKQVEHSDEEMDDDDDDEELFGTVFGVVTVVNITQRKELECMKELQAFVLSKCAPGSPRDQLQALLEDSSRPVGILINERFINIPPQIAVPTLNCLWEELADATARNMKYKFCYYLMLSKTYFMASPAMAGKGKKQQSKEEQRMFVNSEEELFHQASMLSIDYSVAGERDNAIGGDWQEEEEELEPFRTLMVIPAEKIPQIMGKMSELYATPMQS